MAGSFRTPVWPRSILARTTAAALAVIATADCDYAPGVGRCGIESRALEYRAETSFLELSETRGTENAPWVIWHVRVTPSVGGARTVSLRQGPPEAPGRLLYAFPLVNPVPASGVITQVFVRTPYAGAVPFAELWELVQRQPVSFEVVLDGDARPLAVGPLLNTGSSDWQEVCT